MSHFSFRYIVVVMPTAGKFSGRVELPHCTLGGLPDVDYSLAYFCLVGCDSESMEMLGIRLPEALPQVGDLGTSV
jgi:hypothetical protein